MFHLSGKSDEWESEVEVLASCLLKTEDEKEKACAQKPFLGPKHLEPMGSFNE